MVKKDMYILCSSFECKTMLVQCPIKIFHSVKLSNRVIKTCSPNKCKSSVYRLENKMIRNIVNYKYS